MRICLYGASSPDIDRSYIEDVYALGLLLARQGHSLVYGGGAQSVMGAAARGFHDGGAEVIGIAPRFLNVDGILYPGCTQLIFTETMRERKQKMEDMADAFILAPGGIGSYEEFFEILTLKQLGRHNKPIAVFNLRGCYEPLQKLLENAVQGGFARSGCLNIYRMFDRAEPLTDYLEHYDPAAVDLKHLKNI